MDSIEKIKTEGEKVAKGEVLAKYYTIQKEEIESQIENVDIQIQEALEGQTDIFSSDINAINTKIESRLMQIAKKNNIQEINENKADINNYITKKAKISGRLSPAGSNINNLIEQKNELERRLLEGSTSIVAPMAGVVSYRIDNLENELTFENLDNITVDYLDKLDIKEGKIVGTSNNSVKVVNNFKCYIAIESDTDEANKAEVGDKLKIKFSTGEEISATIEKINQGKKSRVLILKIIQNVEGLINYRKATIEVTWWSAKGLKVPNSSIIYDNGLSYVVKTEAGIEKKALVKIVKKNSKYSIVGTYGTGELLELGLTEEEIKKVEKINLYDEIIVDPEI